MTELTRRGFIVGAGAGIAAAAIGRLPDPEAGPAHVCIAELEPGAEDETEWIASGEYIFSGLTWVDDWHMSETRIPYREVNGRIEFGDL